MELDLKEEGLCDQAEDVVGMFTAKTPFNSYKKDNSDLKPDDRPWVALVTKQGLYFHYQLSVIDKSSALGAYRSRHVNDTRYLHENQTINHKRSSKGNNYVRPEIRVEKKLVFDLKDLLRKNITLDMTDEEIDRISFVKTQVTNVKQKRQLLAMDQDGAMYYFTSRTMKQFMFYGKYQHSKEPKAIHDFTLYGTAGYFISYDNHFAFTKHMNKNLED